MRFIFNFMNLNEKEKLSNQQKFKIDNIIFGLAGIVLFILFWEICGRIFIINKNLKHFENFLPLPALKELLLLLLTRNFWLSVLASLRRILIGISLAFTIAIFSGLLIGFYKRLRQLTNIPINFIRMISPLAWMPIALIIFPGFEDAIIFLITIATIWPILINIVQGVNNVNPEWIKMAKNQGARDYQLLFMVILPASIPYVLTGLRLAIGIAWIVLVPAELLGISSGLGYLINDARDTMEYGKLMAIVIAIGIFGYTIDTLFQLVQKRFDWKYKN